MTRLELENRLIDFAVDIIHLVKFHKNDFVGLHLSKQVIRSATSAPLNYGEAQSAQSTKDFIHKLQICLKELRETLINLKIIKKAGLSDDENLLERVIKENNELISIFVKTVETIKQKHNL